MGAGKANYNSQEIAGRKSSSEGAEADLWHPEELPLPILPLIRLVLPLCLDNKKCEFHTLLWKDADSCLRSGGRGGKISNLNSRGTLDIYISAFCFFFFPLLPFMGTEIKHHSVNVQSLLVLRTNTKLFNMIIKVLYGPLLPASLPNLGHITDHANSAGPPSDPPRCLVLPAKRSLPNCTLCLEFTYPFKNCPQPPHPVKTSLSISTQLKRLLTSSFPSL